MSYLSAAKDYEITITSVTSSLFGVYPGWHVLVLVLWVWRTLLLDNHTTNLWMSWSSKSSFSWLTQSQILSCSIHHVAWLSATLELNPPCLAGVFSTLKQCILQTKCKCVLNWWNQFISSQYHVYQLPIVGLGLSPITHIPKYSQHFLILLFYDPHLKPPKNKDILSHSHA